MNFDWDINKAAENERKHDVTFVEARKVFFDNNFYEDYDDEHSDAKEKRFICIGNSSKRLLRVSYTIRQDETGNEVIRIISARKAGSEEERNYNEQNR